MRPRILLTDIETAPDVAYVWGVYQTNAIAIARHWYVLSVGYKWADEDEIKVVSLPQYKGYKGGNSTEKALLKDVWKLLDEADIVVAHNGAGFDVKKLNARFIDHGFEPPSPYKVIDTKRDLASVAMFSSNRLNWLCKQLGIGKKTAEHQDFEMWEGCMAGDKAAWRDMVTYNGHDVKLLDELWSRIAAWIPIPNAAVYNVGTLTCVNPKCTGGKLIKRGFTYAKTRVYQLYRCNKCGTQARSVKSEKTGALVRPVL